MTESENETRRGESGGVAGLRDQSTVREVDDSVSDVPVSVARLRIVYAVDPTDEATSHVLPTDDAFLVGRGVEASGIALADDRMSRVHFRIAWDGRQAAFRLGDARSKNGTYVNGSKTLSTALKHGDVIRAGSSLFVFEEGDVMADVRERAERAAPTSLTALLLGETGSGKEVLARVLHEKSGRAGRFVAVNCAALPRELVAAELFGHTRGAFSGATQSRPGLFVAANEGTLLLDEIGDLPLELQPVLLRVLQEQTLRPVGSEEEVRVKVRVVAATHTDLAKAITAGKFREDLFARLSQVVFGIPPLRERRSEILPLVRAFAGRSLKVALPAAEALLLWHWPRNVRELKSLVETFVALEGARAELSLQYLARTVPAMLAAMTEQQREKSPVGSEARPISVGREQLQALLLRHDGNVSAIARELGKVRPQVYRWLKTYGLSARGAR
jgi:DNA-binding NtrC family response regulator